MARFTSYLKQMSTIQLTNSLVGLLVGFPIIVLGQSNTHCDIIT